MLSCDLVSSVPPLWRLERDPGVVLGLSYRSCDLQPVRRFVKGIVIKYNSHSFFEERRGVLLNLLTNNGGAAVGIAPQYRGQ